MQQINPLIARLPEPLRSSASDALRAGSWTAIRKSIAAFGASDFIKRAPELKVHVLSSYNVESIEQALRLGFYCIPSRPRITFSPYNSIEQELLNPKSPVYTSDISAAVVIWRVDELLPELYHPNSGSGAANLAVKLKELASRIERMMGFYLKNGNAPIFVSTLPVPAIFGGVILSPQQNPGLVAGLCEINSAIYGLAKLDPRVRILDLNLWSAQEGAKYYDLQMDYLARQPLTISGAVSLGMFVARNLRPLVAPRRKVLAIDLDNTLWGGILGEDGVGHLKIGHDFPGNIFLRIQREILELKNQGVLLAILSKNNEADVRRAFEELPDILLKWDDFTCKKIDFNHKHLNLRDAAKALGLGTDSFAFIDDADYEREQMKAFNPEVEVLNESHDPLRILQSLLAYDGFDVHRLSDEDRNRHVSYELQAVRNTDGHEDHLEEFLASLELCAKLDPVDNSNLERVVQLLGKTNQFNVTTRRHKHDDLKRMLAMEGTIAFTLRLGDRFGDQGIVGVLLAVPEKEGKTLRVDSFLVSCRALGRGVEEVLWSALVNSAHERGYARMVAEYIPTAKNDVVKNVFDRLGMSPTGLDGASSNYLLEPLSHIKPPAWFKIN